jgi:hypothetical protein
VAQPVGEHQHQARRRAVVENHRHLRAGSPHVQL